MGKTAVNVLQIGLLLLALAGGWLGFSYINQVSSQTGEGVLWILGVILITIVALAIGLLLNIILHEGGHLVGGLLTGYSFVLFNVWKWTIFKENEKLAIRKYSFAGAAGGCFLSPPDMKNGTFPYRIFISGGFVVDFVLCIIFLALFFIFAPVADLCARAFLVIALVSLFLCLMNLIPHNVVLPNDGYILFNFGKAGNKAIRRGFWSSLKIQALVAEGTRPRDIPTELFDWVNIDDINDIFSFETVCNKYQYWLDKQELSEARTLLQALCDNYDELPDMVKMACYSELLFHELIGECRQTEIDRLYNKDLKNYIKAAASEISVNRVMYAYARLVSKDAAKAQEHLGLFEKACNAPLHTGAVQGERELIALVDAIAAERESNEKTS